MLMQIHQTWKLIKNFYLGMVKNGSGQSVLGTVKLTASQEFLDGINGFFASW